MKGLPEGQLASDIGGEALESWRHVHCLVLSIQKLPQEDVDLFINGWLEGTERAVRKNLPVYFPLLSVPFSVQCSKDVYLRIELSQSVDMRFV